MKDAKTEKPFSPFASAPVQRMIGDVCNDCGEPLRFYVGRRIQGIACSSCPMFFVSFGTHSVGQRPQRVPKSLQRFMDRRRETVS